MKIEIIEKLNFSNRIKIARIFFIFSALYGLFMRFYKITDFIPATYKHILEAHSHVAFLGWGFLAVITLVDYAFLENYANTSKFLKRLYLIMSLTILGMLISFPLQGYHFFSIFFLSVFLITSYLYLWKIWKLLQDKKDIATKFLKTGIHFYFLSSIAVWSIGVISVKLGKQLIYHNTIYFYLHFLYNGFFVFALFGLLYNYILKNKIRINQLYLLRFYQLTLLACIPAYSLSLLWTLMPKYVYVIGFIAGLLQLISLFYLFPIVKKTAQHLNKKFYKFLFLFVIVSFYIKTILQFLSVFPFFMQKALQLKPFFIIGYLHLFTLSFMSLFIILLLLILPKAKLSITGVKLIVIGVFLSEILLFLQGLMLLSFKGIPFIDILLFIVSAFIPIGILTIHFSRKKQ